MNQPQNKFGFGLLVLLVLYLPFQTYLDIPTIGGGINVLNVLMLLLLVQSFSAPVAATPGYSLASKVIAGFVIWAAFSALMNAGASDVTTAITEWKRTYLICFLFAITYRIVSTEDEVKTLLKAVSVVTVLIAIQQLRNTYEFRDANYSHSMRFGGIFGKGGENDVASFLAINSMWFLFWSREVIRLPRLLPLACFLLTFLACLFGFSRAGYIAFAVSSLWYAIHRSRIMLVMIVLALLTIPVWAPEPVKDRIFMLQSEKIEEDASSQNRLLLWAGAKTMIAENPAFGVGPGNFMREIDNYVSFDKEHPRASHNMYLRFAAETGYIGLGLFIAVLLVLFREAWTLSRKHVDWRKTLGVAYGGTVCAIAVINVFGDRFLREELTGYIWITSAIAFKINSLPARKELEQSEG